MECAIPSLQKGAACLAQTGGDLGRTKAESGYIFILLLIFG